METHHRKLHNYLIKEAMAIDNLQKISGKKKVVD